MQKLRGVFLVSDGIMVEFEDGMSCYYPANFLLEQATAGPNRIFMDFDPSPLSEATRNLPPLGVNIAEATRDTLQ